MVLIVRQPDQHIPRPSENAFRFELGLNHQRVYRSKTGQNYFLKAQYIHRQFGVSVAVINLEKLDCANLQRTVSKVSVRL